MGMEIYDVVVSHPTNFHSGSHQLSVKENVGGQSRYVNGAAFGCSRDYATDSDVVAIKQFLAEHHCEVVSLTKNSSDKKDNG